MNYNIYKWNPWTGCHKKSEGCKLCSSSTMYLDYYANIALNLSYFDLPLQRNKQGQYLFPSGSYIAVEYNSDFFIQDMDFFRPYLWNIMKARPDIYFRMVTKRPERIANHLPKDWGDGWDNIYIGCTTENQKRADERLPIYCEIPMKHHDILAQPLLEDINFQPYFEKYSDILEIVFLEGQFCHPPYTLEECRPCDYKWVKHIADQCKKYNILFSFDLTGTKWINEQGQKLLVNPFCDDMAILAKQTSLTTGKVFGFSKDDTYTLTPIFKEE